MLPAESNVTPGISLLLRTRGPIPERNSRLPTRFACGNAPTGSGARELSKDWLMIRGRKTEIGGQRYKSAARRSGVTILRDGNRRRPETPRGSSPSFQRFNLAVARRSIRLQRI